MVAATGSLERAQVDAYGNVDFDVADRHPFSTVTELPGRVVDFAQENRCRLLANAFVAWTSPMVYAAGVIGGIVNACFSEENRIVNGESPSWVASVLVLFSGAAYLFPREDAHWTDEANACCFLYVLPIYLACDTIVRFANTYSRTVKEPVRKEVQNLPSDGNKAKRHSE